MKAAAIKALAFVLAACAPDLEGSDQGRCGSAVPCLPGFECYRGFCLAVGDPAASDPVFETDAGDPTGSELVPDARVPLAGEVPVVNVSQPETPSVTPKSASTSSALDAGRSEPVLDASANGAPTAPVVDTSHDAAAPSPPATPSPPSTTPSPTEPQDAGAQDAGAQDAGGARDAGSARDAGAPPDVCKIGICCPRGNQSQGSSENQGNEAIGRGRCACLPSIMCALISPRGRK